MEEQTEQDEKNYLEGIPLNSELKIGDIFLRSNSLDIAELKNLLIELLKSSEVREYLEIFQTKKKLNGGYLG